MEYNEIYFELRRVMSKFEMELDVEDAKFLGRTWVIYGQFVPLYFILSLWLDVEFEFWYVDDKCQVAFH